MILKGLIFRIKRYFDWIRIQDGNPGYRARGLAAGVFAGCFPLFGFQTLLGLILSILLRGNHFMAAAGTLISNPFTYLPLYWLNYKVGCAFLGNGEDLILLSSFTWKEIFNQGLLFALRIFLGSGLVGVISSSFSGILIYILLKIKEGRVY